MEINGEEERRSREDEGKEVHYSLLNYSPCLAFQKVVQFILKCLGLESSPSSSSSSSSSSPPLIEEQNQETETVEKTGFMARITAILRRRPKPPYSSGRPGQNG